jgi:hypothetical protein
MGNMSSKQRHAERGRDFRKNRQSPDALKAKALRLAGASWIVTPPVKNILRNHQINRKRNRLSGSRFGIVYDAGRRPMHQ